MVWCDDESAQWCEIVLPAVFLPDRSVAKRIHQANRILILADRKLVLVDPIDDDEEWDRIACESLPYIALGINGVFVSGARSPWVRTP